MTEELSVQRVSGECSNGGIASRSHTESVGTLEGREIKASEKLRLRKSESVVFERLRKLVCAESVNV
jgi:hypothetical protein